MRFLCLFFMLLTLKQQLNAASASSYYFELPKLPAVLKSAIGNDATQTNLLSMLYKGDSEKFDKLSVCVFHNITRTVFCV